MQTTSSKAARQLLGFSCNVPVRAEYGFDFCASKLLLFVTVVTAAACSAHAGCFFPPCGLCTFMACSSKRCCCFGSGLAASHCCSPILLPSWSSSPLLSSACLMCRSSQTKQLRQQRCLFWQQVWPVLGDASLEQEWVPTRFP